MIGTYPHLLEHTGENNSGNYVYFFMQIDTVTILRRVWKDAYFISTGGLESCVPFDFIVDVSIIMLM